ncbi:MAG TPA: transporter substrate-binding domain-containing protein [Syntrophobacter fumaroxidans]|nr:transporter substrate-binding domain-containing protein [Syntrophobacter fumaroxidans]
MFRKCLSALWVPALLLTWGIAFAVTPFEVFDGSVLNQVIKRNKLMVGMEVKFFPFEYADKNGRPLGFDVEIAGLAAKELGVELEIKDMEFSGLIPALQGGKVDMIISGMTRTLTRAKTVSFTQPYFETGLCALLSNRRAPDVKDVKELNAPGRVIAVKLGTTGDLVTAKMFPEAQVNRYKEETACVREVVTGRADAFLYDQLSIGKHHKENPDTTRAVLTPFTYEPFAMAIRKGDPDFLNWLNQFLETIRADGRYRELHEKYFGDILR